MGSAADVFAQHEQALVEVRDTIEIARREGLGFDTFAALIESALQHPGDPERAQRVLDCLHYWVGFGYDAETQQWKHPGLVEASNATARLRNQLRRLELHMDRFSACHPGEAYQRLTDRVAELNYVATDDPAVDELRNKQVERVRGYIRDTETWGNAQDALPQPTIISIQNDVRTLHLALVTSLAKGRSRWATVRRFAARCESLDRERVVQLLQAAPTARARKGRQKAVRTAVEPVLTMEFARYLFDAGFNPLVDAAACGLRPDILDSTANPAVYVEAKQYEKVSDRIPASLREDIAQTLNTWARLSKRWVVPEAFLLVFRRSGRSIELEEQELVVGGGRLYVIVVDLASAKESGSRAKEPVRINLRELMSMPVV